MTEIKDQPPPIAQPNRVPVWDLVIADMRGLFTLDRLSCSDLSALALLDDMRQRDAIGRERYGVPLTTHNGRDHLVDAYQEALDLLVYMRAVVEEVGTSHVNCIAAVDLYTQMLVNCLRLRCMISRRKTT